MPTNDDNHTLAPSPHKLTSASPLLSRSSIPQAPSNAIPINSSSTNTRTALSKRGLSDINDSKINHHADVQYPGSMQQQHPADELHYGDPSVSSSTASNLSMPNPSSSSSNIPHSSITNTTPPFLYQQNASISPNLGNIMPSAIKSDVRYERLAEGEDDDEDILDSERICEDSDIETEIMIRGIRGKSGTAPLVSGTANSSVNRTERRPKSNSLIPQGDNPLVKKKISIFRIALATICFAGLQFGWALQISLLTPFMLELGLPDGLVSLIWACGPISGLTIQPLVGSLSDKYNTRIGRRSPWILLGSIFVVLSLLIIPNSPDIGYLFVKQKNANWFTLILATAGFWILDISNNAMQGPCRALLADIAPNSQQAVGSAIFSVWLALGNVTGYMAGFVDWSQWTGFTKTEVCGRACVNLRTAFTISIVFLVFSTIITLIFARERKSSKRAARLNEEFTEEIHRHHSSTRARNCCVNLCKKVVLDNPASVIGIKMLSLPWTMKYVLLVTFFSWFGWFAFLIYITHWMGANVFRGSPKVGSENYERYEEGVRWGAFGLAGNAAISFFFSPMVPYLIRVMGHKFVWFGGQLCLFLSLLLPAFVFNKWAAVAVISSFGIPWSITMTVPFALAAIIAPDEDKGIYMGILNIAVTAPQLVMSGLGPLFSWLFDRNPVAPLVAGSASALFSAILCFLLIPSTATKNSVPKERANSADEFQTHLSSGHVIEETDIVHDTPESDDDTSEEHFVMSHGSS